MPIDIDLDEDVPVRMEDNPSYQRLKELRKRTDLEARSSPLMREKFTSLDGREYPLRLRYYQVQGVMHLLVMKRFVLGDDTGLGKCSTPDTFVSTGEGLVRLGELNPGGLEPDTFVPVDGRTVSIGGQLHPIKRFYYGGNKPTIRVRTRYDYGVEGTLVHPLLVRTPDGREVWKRLRELEVGDHLCVDRRSGSFAREEPELPLPDMSGSASNLKRYPLPTRMNPELARLLAYIVGESWTGSGYSATISQSREVNPESHADIEALVRSQFGYTGGKPSDTSVPLYSKEIRAYLEGLGIGRGLARDKCVPWPIFRSTRASVAQFLRGLFEAEAWVGPANISFSSASARLAEEVQMLLLQFGIVTKRDSGKVKGYDHIYWTVTVSGEGCRIFAREIGLITARKRAALEAFPPRMNTNHDVVPHARDLVMDLHARILQAVTRRGSNESRAGSGMKQFGNRLSGLQFVKSGRSNPSYKFLQRLLSCSEEAGTSPTPEHEALARVVENHYFYDPITSLDAGSAEVMDLEVDSAEHAYVAGGVVSHNTLQSIAATCYLWEKNPNLKVIVLTSKSAIEQWAGEFDKFTHSTRVYVSRGSPKQRAKVREAFQASQGPSVLVMGYRSAVQDFAEMQTWEGFLLICDEAAYFKNHATQLHQVVAHMGSRAERLWGLTATIIKNHLVEGWGVYRVVVPGLFGSMNHFMNEYCVTRMQTLPGTRRQVPVIVGYRQRDIAAFREKIDPYFLGRPKFEVASELPPLVTRHVECTLTRFQEEKYAEALSGLLAIGVKDETTGTVAQEEREVTKLTAVTYCQQIVNHPELIGCEGDSDKLDTLVDLLTNGELAGEKVIIYTRFRKMVDIIAPTLIKAGVKAVRITGAEDEKARKASQDAFQDPKGDVRAVVITSAAAEAINLQAAKALVFFDTPWSAGDYLQILGRMIRIGSVHDRCYALHLIVRNTIDDRVVKVLSKKMGLVESVIGKRIKGVDEGVTVEAVNDLSDLFESLVADARARGK